MGCYRDENNNGRYYGNDPNIAWNEEEQWGCKELKLSGRSQVVNHKIAVESVEQESQTVDNGFPERQFTLTVFDNSVKLVAAAGAVLLGTASVLI